ncbi:MAG: gamma-glutamyltranspeptidase [Acidimicrobiaceae bacterium]|nr:gamma-glutamyltranspeptidase [Acidimicrobiaceae bacterium]
MTDQTSTPTPGGNWIGTLSTTDPLATKAGIDVLRSGGSAVDAAIAANAVLSVTAQHMCGLGGDLLAIVYDPSQADLNKRVVGLNSSGTSSKRASAARLRAEGKAAMPRSGRIESVTVPGCVDGWSELHARYGQLPWSRLFDSAIELARNGFAASETFTEDAEEISALKAASEFRSSFNKHYETGTLVRRPGIAGVLENLQRGSRDDFYLRGFGQELIEISAGYFDKNDFVSSCARWVEPISVDAFGRTIHSLPPNSQGAVLLAASSIADEIGVTGELQQDELMHVLIESARLGGFDRNQWLCDGAEFYTHFTTSELSRRASLFDRERSVILPDAYTESGDTIALLAVDSSGLGISLIQSNASSFGSRLLTPTSQIFLHNRGMGFSLEPDSPNEFGPNKRPMHTLTPVLATKPGGKLDLLVGTMGGDAQPQILLQLLVNRLILNMEPEAAISASRFILEPPAPLQTQTFSTWEKKGKVSVRLESTANPQLAINLKRRGHSVRTAIPLDSTFGHSHMIQITDSAAVGFCDERSRGGICLQGFVRP